MWVLLFPILLIWSSYFLLLFFDLLVFDWNMCKSIEIQLHIVSINNIFNHILLVMNNIFSISCKFLQLFFVNYLELILFKIAGVIVIAHESSQKNLWNYFIHSSPQMFPTWNLNLYTSIIVSVNVENTSIKICTYWMIRFWTSINFTLKFHTQFVQFATIGTSLIFQFSFNNLSHDYLMVHIFL